MQPEDRCISDVLEGQKCVTIILGHKIIGPLDPIKRAGIHESVHCSMQGGPLLVVHGVITPLIAAITKFYN